MSSTNRESADSEPSATGTVIFEDLVVFTGVDFIDRGFVVVRDGRIVKVGSGAFPSDVETAVRRISKPGCTLLPGLIDCHLHGLFGNERCIEESLRFGVTTVMDMHNEPYHIQKLQKLAEEDKHRFADFLCCGTAATVDGGWPTPVVLAHGRTPQALRTVESWPKLTNPAQAEGYVEQQIEQSRASYVKIMHELGDTLALPVSLPQPDIKIWQAVVRAAHDHGLIAVGHAFSYQGALGLLIAGIDGLTHIWMDEPISDELIDLMKANNAHCNPTLSCVASQTRQGHDLKVAFSQDPLAQRMLFDPAPRQFLGLGNEKASVENGYNNTRALYRAGIPMIIGSDASGQPKGQTYGLTLHMELWQMIHIIGMTPIEALRSTTSITAERFRLNDRGLIEEGRKADLTLVQGDVRVLLQDRDTLCLPLLGVWRDGCLASVYASEY